MARRRSARLATSASKTPQGSSAAPNLSTLTEHEDSAGKKAPQSLDAIVTSPLLAVPGTPSESLPVKPPMSEMHPQKAHQTMAPPSSSLRLGFTDIKPRNKDGPSSRLPAAIQATPSKLSGTPPSSSFSFRVAHETSSSSTSDLKLSSEAQRIMDSIRADVAKYRVELAADRQREKVLEEEIAGRRIAQPKGKSGRFSAAHVAEFKKMDSIANHPSAFRAQLARGTPQPCTLKRSSSKPNLGHGEAVAAPPRTGVLKRIQSKANLNEAEPTRSGLKRTQSKANLNAAEPTTRSNLKRTQSKANLNDAEPTRSSLKRTQSKVNLNEAEPARTGLKRSQSKASMQEAGSVRNRYGFVASKATGTKECMDDGDHVPSPAKRARQLVTDDTSTNRPVSRDGSVLTRPKSAGGPASNIPRSKSSLSLLMTPTKSSLARTQSVKSPAQGSMVNSRAKTSVGGLTPSATIPDLSTLVKETTAMEAPALPSSRLDRVKAMFRGRRSSPGKAKSNLPLPASGTFTTIRNAGGSVPSLFGKTPSSALSKRVAFTPDRTRTSVSQQSPSPVKAAGSVVRSSGGHVFYPALDAVLDEAATMDEGGISYPDLSSRRPLPEPPVKVKTFSGSDDTAGPSEFTFAADQTIVFGPLSSMRFGGSPGQVSVRQVRHSMAPGQKAMMPGSFPASVLAGDADESEVSLSRPESAVAANKENVAPSSPMDKALLLSGRMAGRMGKSVAVPSLPRDGVPGFPHGMGSKKRHRVSTDEQEAALEEGERAAKRARSNAVPEGDALLAPRLMASTRKSAGTPSPKKKTTKQGLSLGRLHLLARPKMRK